MRIRSFAPAAADAPPVTILKPLCGEEHELYDCLRSFCDQIYPTFQIVFGVSEPNDSAVGAVRKLQREFPLRDIQIAIDPRQHGSSRKVSNLINMMPLARYDLLVIADSDIRVTRSYLAKIVAPLLDPGVGIVTCLYRGSPRRGLWSLLGSLFINDWFIPSVRVAALSGSRSFAFGATIALRREVLAGIGGFKSIVNQLADDYRLGELTRRMGLRTIRAVRPVGYALSFVTFGVPVAALGAVLAAGATPALAMLGTTAMLRVMLHWDVRKPGSALCLFVLPLRDTLSVSLWALGFLTRRVRWRDDRYQVSRDGSVQPVARPSLW
jgi:ceramide glucosyltransferase